MKEWKKYHEIAAVVGSGTIVGAVLENTWEESEDYGLKLGDEFRELVKSNQIQNFRLDENNKLIIEYSDSDIDYIKYNMTKKSSMADEELKALIKRTSNIKGWLLEDLVFHEKLIKKFMLSQKYTGIGRYCYSEEGIVCASVYFKSSCDAEIFHKSMIPGIVDILTRENNWLTIAFLNINPIKNDIKKAGVLIY